MQGYPYVDDNDKDGGGGDNRGREIEEGRGRKVH